MSQLLYELISATLCERPLAEKDAQNVSDGDWQQCFELALSQQVLAMTFPVMSALDKRLRPEFTLWSKWMAYAQSVDSQSRHKREVVRKIGSWLAEEGLTTSIIKGFSLSVLYPRPELRECGDVDIYSANDYESVNACLTKHGLSIGKPDGHHVHVTVDGVSVEHHFALCNSRVRHGMDGPVEALLRLAEKKQSTALPGICFPSPAFTSLFTGWHAYKHFLAEKIELRHVVDWALALRQLTAEESVTLHEAKGNARWSRFADTLTAIAVHRLHLPEEWFPQKELEAASEISPELEQKVWDDIIDSTHTPHGRTSNHRRLNIARRMLQNGWKYREFADVGAVVYLWHEFVGYLKG